jgi:hypothetical protein
MPGGEKTRQISKKEVKDTRFMETHQWTLQVEKILGCLSVNLRFESVGRVDPPTFPGWSGLQVGQNKNMEE